MSTEIAAQLRAIADTLDQGGTTVGGPRRPKVIPQSEWPVDPRTPSRRIPPQPKWVADENGDLVAAEDFWVDGIPGAVKGARNSHYSHSMILNIIGGDHPRHYFIFVPTPKEAPWSAAYRCPADLGWMDGEGYRHDPELPPDVNYRKWIAAGAPRKNGGGFYDNAGRPVSGDEWAEWANSKRRGA